MTRDKKYVDMMNQWFILKQEGKGIEKYFPQKRDRDRQRRSVHDVSGGAPCLSDDPGIRWI